MDTQSDGPEVKGQQQLEEYSFLDKSLLEKTLICNRCSRHLNVPPILYNENIGNICGRCSSDATLGAVLRQQVYEDLIKNLTFPCINKNYGCIEVLKFDDVLLHEKHCRFQCTNCPLFYKHLFPEKFCSWRGTKELLCDHLKSHPESFLDPPQFEWPQDGKNMLFFTNVGNQVITVVIKYEKLNKYVCLVMINGTEVVSRCFWYQLELLADEDKSNSIILRRNRLEPFSDIVETLRYPEKTLEVDVDRISEILQNSKKVFAKFKIAKKSKKTIIQITGVKDGDLFSQDSSITATEIKNAPDDEILAELECPVCKEFMLPPIYLCPTGHSICSDCKALISVCPLCRYRVSQGRNYILEKLTQTLNYPCINREIGCSFVTTSDKIKRHQTYCELSENPCFLKCGWKGPTPGLYNHLLDKHRHLVLPHNTAIIMDPLNYDRCDYFLYVMGELFYVSLRYCNGFTIKYNIQYIGYLESEPKYKYTMQFSPVPEFCPCITVTNFCQSHNGNFEESLGPGMLSIPGDLLKYYFSQSGFCYNKINITKVC